MEGRRCLAFAGGSQLFVWLPGRLFLPLRPCNPTKDLDIAELVKDGNWGFYIHSVSDFTVI
jgi:hypothetical protein